MKIFRLPSKMCSQRLSNYNFCVHKYISRRKVFFNIILFLYLFRKLSERKQFVFLEKSYWRMVKTAFYVFIGTISGKTIFRKSLQFYHHFRTLSEKSSAFRQKFFNKLVKTVFYASIGISWGKTIFSIDSFSNSFGEWKKNFLPAPEILPAVLSKLDSTCLTEFWGKLLFLKKKTFFLSN